MLSDHLNTAGAFCVIICATEPAARESIAAFAVDNPTATKTGRLFFDFPGGARVRFDWPEGEPPRFSNWPSIDYLEYRGVTPSDALRKVLAERVRPSGETVET